MARPSLPSHLKIVKGTAQKCRMNSQEPKPSKPLSATPKVLKSKAEKAAYKYLKSKIPAGVAFDTDEPALVLAAKLWVVIEDGDDATTATYTQLGSILGKFGMTPSERQKVSVAEKKSKDDWDDL